MKKLKKIPHFDDEDKERDFWDSHDLTDYFDMSKPQSVIFPNLKLSRKTISLRMPEWLWAELKVLANKRDMAYQSLMKFVLTDWVQKERHASAN